MPNQIIEWNRFSILVSKKMIPTTKQDLKDQIKSIIPKKYQDILVTTRNN